MCIHPKHQEEPLEISKASVGESSTSSEESRICGSVAGGREAGREDLQESGANFKSGKHQ